MCTLHLPGPTSSAAGPRQSCPRNSLAGTFQEALGLTLTCRNIWPASLHSRVHPLALTPACVSQALCDGATGPLSSPCRMQATRWCRRPWHEGAPNRRK